MKNGVNSNPAPGSRAARRSSRAIIAAVLALMLAAVCASAAFAASQRAPLRSKYFGFYAAEFYRGSNMAQSLKHSDVNSDGATDITFLDAEKSQIAIMLNTPSGFSKAKDEPADLNAIRYDDRFVRHGVPLERKVYDYEFLTLAGDTLESLVVIAEPRWLIVYRQDKYMQFYEYSRVQLDEANYSKARAAGRDVDGDGSSDLIIMCPDFFVLVPNAPAAEFGRNARYIPAGSEYGSEPLQFEVFDINSDGFNDLVYSYSSKTANLRVRFGSAAGAFLAEEAYDLLGLRCMCLLKAPPPGPGGTAENALGCVLETSNRLVAYRIESKPARPKDRLIKLSTVYFNKDDRGNKSQVMLHDFNSDGADDLAVVNPETGRLGIYLYSADNRLESYASFPFATGIAGAFAAGSSKKSVTNIISYSKDRLLKASIDSAGMKYEFSGPVDTFGRAFFAAPFTTASGAKKVAVFSRDGGAVNLWQADSDLSGVVPAAARVDHQLEGLTALKISCASEEISFFMAYFKYDAPKPFFRHADGAFRPGQFTDGSQTAAMNVNNTAVRDFDSDGSAEVLFGEKNTIKVYAIDLAGRRLIQKDQVNAESTDFECESLCAAPGLVCAYDPESKRFFEYGAAARTMKTVSVEKKFSGSSLAMLNGRPAFINAACAGAVVEAPSLAFEKYGFAEYEEIKNGRYNNLIARDINGDGAADLVLTCGAQNYLDVFNFIGGVWKLSLRFKIFNTKQFSQYASYTSEPQAIDSADFDGDGRNDLAMLVHNKVIVYYSDGPRIAREQSKKGGK